MIGRTNAGGGLGKSTLIVQTESGSVVTVSKGEETKSALEKYGVWAFPGLSAGEWTVKAVKDGLSVTKTVTMDGTSSLTLILYFNQIPEFSYTGDYEIVDDNDNPIITSQGNWKIRFLTSGTLTFTELRGAADGIDVFLVGGGGGGGYGGYHVFDGTGGGGGYTNTGLDIPIEENISYAIDVGSGGACGTNSNYSGNDGGNTAAFSLTAIGGKGGAAGGSSAKPGSDGGSGAGCGGNGNDGNYQPSAGGTDGSDGEDALRAGTVYAKGGKGQGTTTREFGKAEGTPYSPGGHGAGSTAIDGTIQGSGGRGCRNGGTAVDGKPGIVIIRNHREGAA